MIRWWPLPRWTVWWLCAACGVRSRDYDVPLWNPLWVLIELADDGWGHDHRGRRLCGACRGATGTPGEIAAADEAMRIASFEEHAL